MKILCMHLKIFLCLTAAAILLGIVTVTPCGELADCVRGLAKRITGKG